MNNKSNRAFTLIELLVVIAIIAILAAILFPVFAQAKRAAKQTQGLSNVKNLTLGMMLYTTDSDDVLPPDRFVPTPSSWWGPNVMIWKDFIQPYVKNGGRPMNGLFYSQPGDGGIYTDPLNQASWSDADSITAGVFGDETSRYPRGYAVNKDAGRDEFGGPRNGRCADTIWPEVYPNGDGTYTAYNQGGNLSILQSVANTAMIAPSRKQFDDIEVSEAGKSATDAGHELDTYPGTYSLVAGTGTRGLTFGFFDGHAKNVNFFASLTNDNWGSLGPGGIPACGWNVYWSGPGNGMPWQQGITTDAQQIKEWSN